MLRPDTFALTALLALLTAVGPLSVDMYLPSLPDIGRELAARPAQVQLTISFYLVGFALGQIVYGPISDRHGRKPILLAALALFSIAGLACAFASSIEVLIIARFLQAFGGSGDRALFRRARVGDAARVRGCHVSISGPRWRRLFARGIRAANVRSGARGRRRSHARPNRLAARRCNRGHGMSHSRDLDVFARHSRPKQRSVDTQYLIFGQRCIGHWRLRDQD